MYNEKRESIIVSTFRGPILIFNGDGNLVRKFGPEENGDGQFARPCGICTNSLDEIIVVDTENNRVQLFDEEGNFITTFGSKGSAPDQFCEPFGVCVDWDDNILVADSRTKGFLFLPGGEYQFNKS